MATAWPPGSLTLNPGDVSMWWALLSRSMTSIDPRIASYYSEYDEAARLHSTDGPSGIPAHP
ncbi:hypothetical protein SSAG_04793 [Streptomyces sp. Mg1]|nr:hypothetical protein SSAG_04793 [Streptomyces sp. Mg1]